MEPPSKRKNGCRIWLQEKNWEPFASPNPKPVPTPRPQERQLRKTEIFTSSTEQKTFVPMARPLKSIQLFSPLIPAEVPVASLASLLKRERLASRSEKKKPKWAFGPATPTNLISPIAKSPRIT